MGVLDPDGRDDSGRGQEQSILRRFDTTLAKHSGKVQLNRSSDRVDGFSLYRLLQGLELWNESFCKPRRQVERCSLGLPPPAKERDRRKDNSQVDEHCGQPKVSGFSLDTRRAFDMRSSRGSRLAIIGSR